MQRITFIRSTDHEHLQFAELMNPVQTPVVTPLKYCCQMLSIDVNWLNRTFQTDALWVPISQERKWNRTNLSRSYTLYTITQDYTATVVNKPELLLKLARYSQCSWKYTSSSILHRGYHSKVPGCGTSSSGFCAETMGVSYNFQR